MYYEDSLSGKISERNSNIRVIDLDNLEDEEIVTSCGSSVQSSPFWGYYTYCHATGDNVYWSVEHVKKYLTRMNYYSNYGTSLILTLKITMMMFLQ